MTGYNNTGDNTINIIERIKKLKEENYQKIFSIKKDCQHLMFM